MTLKTKELTRLALLVAVTILLAATPLGYIPLLPTFSLTIMTIPIAVGGLTVKPYASIVLGLVFGITSFLRAPYESVFTIALFEHSVLYVALLTIGGRLLVGLCAAGLCHIYRSKFSKSAKKSTFIVSAGAIGAITSMLNTIIFLSGLYFIFPTDLSGGIAIFGLILTNGIAEAIAAAVITPPIAAVLRK